MKFALKELRTDINVLILKTCTINTIQKMVLHMGNKRGVPHLFRNLDLAGKFTEIWNIYNQCVRYIKSITASENNGTAPPRSFLSLLTLSDLRTTPGNKKENIVRIT